MPERYVPYKSQPHLTGPAQFESLRQDELGLRVQLEGAAVLFDGWLTYRVSDEGDRLLSSKALSGLAKSPICEVENSEYLAWFVRESANARREADLKHWAVVTADEIVDVIAVEAPTLANGDA
jgi:hypothetical protein